MAMIEPRDRLVEAVARLDMVTDMLADVAEGLDSLDRFNASGIVRNSNHALSALHAALYAKLNPRDCHDGFGGTFDPERAWPDPDGKVLEENP